MLSRSNARRRNTLITLLVTALLGAAVACTGGGGDAPVLPPVTNACVSFQGLAPPAGSAVYMQQDAASTCDTLIVDVMVRNVQNVLTVGFDFTYDVSVATYAGHDVSGSNLANGGVTVSATPKSAAEMTPGTVAMAVGREMVATGVNFSANGELVIKLIFNKATQNPRGSTLRVTDTELVSPGNPPTVITPFVPGSGGSLNAT